MLIISMSMHTFIYLSTLNRFIHKKDVVKYSMAQDVHNETPQEILSREVAAETCGVTVKTILEEWLGESYMVVTSLLASFIGQSELDELLKCCPPHGKSILTNSNCQELLQISGGKFMKVVASEYALLCCPLGNTSLLTNVTRVLMSDETFAPILHGFIGDRLPLRTRFKGLLMLLVYSRGVRTTSKLLLPMFRETLRSGEYSLELPRILNELCPGKSFSGKSPEERIAFLCDELVKRNVTIEREEHFGIDSAIVRYNVKIRYGEGPWQIETDKILSEYYGIVVREARHLLNKKKRAKEVAPALKAGDQKMWVRQVHSLLRLRPPYKDLIDERTYEQIVSSNGWIPIEDMKRLLEHQVQKSRTMLPPEGDWIEKMINDHDLYGRFEVGICRISGSMFEGKLCARSLYGHEGRVISANDTFNEFEDVNDPDDCPCRAWVPAERSRLKKLRERGTFVLYDQIQLICAFREGQLDEFQKYRCEASGAGKEDEYCDEKLSKCGSLFFLEFCLRAAVRDNNMKVIKVERKKGHTHHWAIFPQSKYSSDGMGFIPRYYFTGRVAELVYKHSLGTDDLGLMMSEDRELFPSDMGFRIRFGIMPTLRDASSSEFTEQEVEHIFGEERNLDTEGSHIKLIAMETCGAPEIAGGENVTPEQEKNMKAQRSHDPALSIEEAKAKAQMLARDKERQFVRIEFPKFHSGGKNIDKRTEVIKSLKEFVQSLGLLTRHIKTDDTEVDVYELRKRCSWSNEFLAQLAGELGLAQTFDFTCLRQAITRECEDSSENYEILEFIGDAVMDFIVSVDSFLLGEPWDVDVIEKLCRNGVIGKLIPSILKGQLAKYYGQMNPKVEADMMEGILGAVYRSGMGLDEVRQQLRRFFKRIPEVMSRYERSSDSYKELGAAQSVCPYLRPDEGVLDGMFKYQCVSVVDKHLFEQFGLETASAFDCHGESHYAATPFCRIHDKDFATHFTTGNAYSYRRIPSIDTPSLFNRILTAFAEGFIAFMNENITEETHLAIDFDGTNVHSCGVLRIIWNWFHKNFESKSSMLLLDCSGITVDKERKMKQSFHIHFPQAVTNLASLMTKMERLRLDIVGSLAMGSPFGDVVGYHGPRWRETQGDGLVSLSGRAVLCTTYLRQQLSTIGGPVDSTFSQFMNLNDILAIGATCREMRRATLSYLYNTPSERNEFAQRTGHPTELVSSDTGSCGSQDYVLMRVLWASENAQNLVKARVFIPSSMVVSVSDEQSDVVKAVVRQHNNREHKPKEFYLEVVKPRREESVFSPAFWDRTVDASLQDSRKLRMYLNDKYDQVYGQQFRPLFLSHLFLGGRGVKTLNPKSNKQSHLVTCSAHDVETASDNEEEWPVEVAHASVLRLTSLRCPEYRDVYGKLYNAWTEDNNIDDAFPSAAPAKPTDDLLPMFGYECKEGEMLFSEWKLWVEGVCGLQPYIGLEDKWGDTHKTAALQPAYWTYDHKLERANFHIAGDIVFSLDQCASLLEGLTKRQGMDKMAQLLVPNVALNKESINVEYTTSYSPSVFPLFLPPRRKQVSQAAAKQDLFDVR
uniref:RNase III domain-containing protein n=1 Tax=Trypanosoma congolense (strain IL3000) TaxID=1068625 RepID=G0URK4_TRYCI|nr:conserved hypothetical protein [Trypanosoma congolense IL3000]